jgi:hypothetical protein
MHERLEKFFTSLVSGSKSATDLSVEDFGLFDASSDVKESD